MSTWDSIRLAAATVPEVVEGIGQETLARWVVELATELREAQARIPDSADLTRVVTLAMQAVGATENLYDFGCVARVVKTLPDRAAPEEA
jgi:hypothetical protein